MTPEEANKHLREFFSEVSVSARKHGMTATLVVAAISPEYPDARPGRAFAMDTTGERNVEPDVLAAYAYGRASQERREMVNRLLAEAGREAKDQGMFSKGS